MTGTISRALAELFLHLTFILKIEDEADETVDEGDEDNADEDDNMADKLDVNESLLDPAPPLLVLQVLVQLERQDLDHFVVDSQDGVRLPPPFPPSWHIVIVIRQLTV